jgi:DNA polymerase III subunit delta
MFYLFHGNDTYSRDEYVDGLLAKQGDPDMVSLNTTRLDSRLTFSELQQACDALPFLAPARIVLVHDLLASVPDKAFMEKLEAYLPRLPETTRLLFLESQPLPENHRIIRLAAKEETGHVKRFDRPEGAGLERWVRDHVAAKGGRMAPQAAQLLAANVGSDLDALSNEIEKLVIYKGSEDLIEVADVLLLSPYVAEANIFELVDALGGRQGPSAARLFQDKINEGVDPFYLFSMFTRQFRLLLQTKYLLEAGEQPVGIAGQLKVRPFVAEKLARQARGYSMEQLEQIYRRLLEVDVDAKTGRADLLTSLHLLVAGLTVED